MYQFVSTVIDGMTAVDPILGRSRGRASGHAGPARNVPGPVPVDHPMISVQEVFVVHADVIRSTDVEAFVVVLTELADRWIDQLGKSWFSTLRDVTEAVGNSLSNDGKPLTWDFVLDGLERVAISFDDDGNPTGQILVMSPKTAQILKSVPRTAEHEKRYLDIMRRKKEQWDAQKRTRRLPRSGPRARV